jgi:DinB family protein
LISERAEILKALRAGLLVLRRLVRNLEDETLRSRPALGEWAIVEVVAHLADTEERALGRTQAMLDGDLPFLAAYDPDALAVERGYLGMDVAEQLDRFESLRGQQCELLAGLGDDAWLLQGRHEEHGTITVQQLAAHTAGEDADHFAQIARMIPAEPGQA